MSLDEIGRYWSRVNETAQRSLENILKDSIFYAKHSFQYKSKVELRKEILLQVNRKLSGTVNSIVGNTLLIDTSLLIKYVLSTPEIV